MTAERGGGGHKSFPIRDSKAGAEGVRVGERKGEALLRHCLNLFELSLICIFLSWVLEVDLEIGSLRMGCSFL